MKKKVSLLRLGVFKAKQRLLELEKFRLKPGKTSTWDWEVAKKQRSTGHSQNRFVLKLGTGLKVSE